MMQKMIMPTRISANASFIRSMDAISFAPLDMNAMRSDVTIM